MLIPCVHVYRDGDAVPNCFTACDAPTSNPTYYARVTPGTFAGAENFKLDLHEYFRRERARVVARLRALLKGVTRTLG